MSKSIGLHSLAVSVPERVLTNEHWQERYPELVARAKELAAAGSQPSPWKVATQPQPEVAPYVGDPFFGSKERRVLAEDGSALELEARAAREALELAELEPSEIDLLICSSALPDHPGIGNATYLAQELGLEGAAWNVDSEGASSLIAFQTACSLIETGQYRRALVVTSAAYSRVSPANHFESWGLGDAATAMVIGRVAESHGFLGGHSIHTGSGRAAREYRVERDEHASPRLRICKTPRAERALRATAEQYLVACARRALDKAGVTFADIDHFVFNTPFAWSAAFLARTLGIAPSQTSNIHPLYADAGPALLGLNLFHAAHWQELEPGELILLCAIETASNCTAVVVRWGDVALGAAPDGTSLEHLRSIEAESLAHYRLRRLEAEVLDPQRETAGAELRLRQIVAGYTDLAIDEPGIMSLFVEDATAGESPLDDGLRQRARHFITTLERDVAEIFRQRQQGSKVDPEVAAMSLLGIVHWGVCSYREEGRLSRDEAIAQVTQLALHGLVSKPDSAAAV
ncbi:MAG: 3-oxoacyl-[acyl-carrier-protein] synthase III C-terminal domain-containing protein [Acidobacteriota bacterium]